MASALVRQPSLSRLPWTCISTVRGLMNKVSPICRLVLPWATSSMISSSRTVRPAAVRGLRTPRPAARPRGLAPSSLSAAAQAVSRKCAPSRPAVSCTWYSRSSAAAWSPVCAAAAAARSWDWAVA